MDGILNIYKPPGMSSFRALSIVKARLAKELGVASRKLKVGHLGTLDPSASGVLVLLVGRATKLNQQLSGGTKVYQSVFTFGIETDTLDADEGCKVISTSGVIPTREQIEKVLPEMVGEIEIQVPKFSAVHINGKRAYDLARSGVDFTPPTKAVKIERFEMLKKIEPPLQGGEFSITENNSFWVEVECQTGTYIRSLAKLLAEKLGTVAIASTIIRTRVGEFDIKDAKSLDDVTSNDIIKYETKVNP